MPGASVLKTVVLELGQEAGTAEVLDAATLLVHRQGFATHRLATLRLDQALSDGPWDMYLYHERCYYK